MDGSKIGHRRSVSFVSTVSQSVKVFCYFVLCLCAEILYIDVFESSFTFFDMDCVKYIQKIKDFVVSEIFE